MNISKQNIILVTGATGQQGGAVARALLNEGWKVRALVRNLTSEAAWQLNNMGAETVQGNFNDEKSVASALRGVWGVFSVQPSSGQGVAYNITDDDEIRYGSMIAELAAKEKVSHLIYSSANAAGQGVTGVGHFDSKTVIEKAVKELPVPYTILRPSAFMEILMLPGMGLESGEFSFFMHPQQNMQFIAAEDIGKIAANIFSNAERYSGRTLEIAGDTLTGNDIASQISQVSGRSVRYCRFTEQLLKDNDFLNRLAALVDDGRLAGHADTKRLREDFPFIQTLGHWLKNSGKPLLSAAFSKAGPLSLR